jgi:hypothetical protein
MIINGYSLYIGLYIGLYYGYNSYNNPEYIGSILHLVGGLEHVFFPFSWDFHNPNWRRSHIFQRGRYTTNQLWLVIYSLPRKKRRDEGKSLRFRDGRNAPLYCVCFEWDVHSQRSKGLKAYSMRPTHISFFFFKIFAAYFVNSKFELDQPETPETMKASDSVTGCIRFLHCKTGWGFVQPLSDITLL